MKKTWIIVCFLIGLNQNFAQEIDSLFVESDSLKINPEISFDGNNEIINPNSISKFYKKLKENNSKINIVHIGDSHILADLFTGYVRKNLQNQFGNGGRGLIFPHRLAKTNGPSDIRLNSNVNWENHKNTGSITDTNVGLSGIILKTKDPNFVIEVDTKEPANFFNTLKVVTPHNVNYFEIAFSKTVQMTEKAIPVQITHKIKNGEALSIIASRYKVSVAEIKKLNKLKNNNIQAGKTLKIPGNESKNKTVETYSFDGIALNKDENFHFFESAVMQEKAFLIANKNFDSFELNGIVLENKNTGLLYHNIGINGARYSDYNKYPVFFEQLKALAPDLIVLSFGTNESYDKTEAVDFMNQLETFLYQVRNQLPEAAVLVTTPPPSMYKKKHINYLIEDYAKVILDNSEVLNYAVWDMYEQLGKNTSINTKLRGFIANDKVHYTKAGYELQGKLLSEAILKSFEKFNTVQE